MRLAVEAEQLRERSLPSLCRQPGLANTWASSCAHEPGAPTNDAELILGGIVQADKPVLSSRHQCYYYYES